ncbi:probable LRR receptor-like serine/threonine-protein kinase At3g47570 isoform X2 [Malus sylvestris]|uniref:probable LRR receptor-like serine/threonine-protein kinase At3g47570 isoform X2 n=1 Tax=Malus sylvestris TaxID=3752 RepID=UPI0021AC9D43|nr:probable LRR receptor-like serine/threonine-protein kinase At3g47570 isoform X2 [Malus sylvestris]
MHSCKRNLVTNFTAKRERKTESFLFAVRILVRMEHSRRIHGRLILFKLFHGFILLCMTTRLGFAALSSTSLGNETDRLALLDFKKHITQDALHVMSAWNDSIHFCSWAGVTCSHSTKRVLILNLPDQNLAGSLPPSIGNLSYLTSINLGSNSFRGEIPQEIGRLQSLHVLNLSHNSFSGKIPTNLSQCTQLKTLEFRYNELIGSIPKQLSSLLKLRRLLLSTNNLTGTIPSWMGNFSSLHVFDLSGNNFQGSIPNDLGRLTRLQFVGLQAINLSGNIPISLSNASGLQLIDFAENGLTGTIPGENLGTLRSLVVLNLYHNRLGSGKAGDLNFLKFLANCTSLEVLDIVDNQFGGELPVSMSNLSTTLRSLYLGTNSIHGSVPLGIGNLLNLAAIGMENNYFSGSLPEEIGRLKKLEGLSLGGNNFSGPIPSSLGNMTSLTQLYMDDNGFEGRIHPSLGNCQRLLFLDLSSNNLTGTIPKELFRISSISIYMPNNQLTGPLPSEVGNLVNLVELYVSGNKLSGEIPTSLGSCIMLVLLHLKGNEFQGIIPISLKSLRSLEEIDLSSNNLSGQIPEFLGKFRFLSHLNLSYNNFEGKMPEEGIFSNATSLSILGNPKLCGGSSKLHLPACPNTKPPSSRGLLARKVVISVACALAFIIGMSCFHVARSMLKRPRSIPVSSRSYKDWKSGVSYSELVQSTDGFSRENLIGSGSFGSVYKGVVPGDGTLVAVKVLNLQQQGASKSFMDECKALRSIRHRNLLKIITACSSIDNQGQDFKSLVFEYIVNGSLEMWLHLKNDEHTHSKRLSLVQRLNIAIDVASALDYIHHHCETSIVHCDMKPNNVLLDEDMVAHVGDFGLARFLLEASNDLAQSQTISTGLKGSIGYIPPEYGMGGQVSILGDVYSFGILLLEMFTGRRPTDDMFKDGLSIHQFTAMAMPDHAMDIVDPLLLVECEDANVDGSPIQARRLVECSVSVMQIGLSCSATSPSKRMLMDAVVNKLKTIRDSYLNLRGKGKKYKCESSILLEPVVQENYGHSPFNLHPTVEDIKSNGERPHLNLVV